MKGQLFNFKSFLQFVILLSVVGVISIAQAQKVVELSVSSDESELEIWTKGSCDGPHNNKGCIGVTGQVLINFNLKRKSCSTGGFWRLDHVALSNEEKGEPGDIDEDVADDLKANMETGRVTPHKQTKRSIQIRDYNKNKFDIWYTVYAKCSEGDMMVKTDPRIRNDGTGR